MESFDCIGPMDFRYLPRDNELREKIKAYAPLAIFTRIRRIVPELVIPRLGSLEKRLLLIATENNTVIVPKRVDGIHDGTITCGKIWRGYANRLESRRRSIEQLSLAFSSFKEARRYDRLADLTYFSLSALAVEANVADDVRHLFRSEIDEVTLEWGEDRVGSSTMPHKVNPVDFELVKSFWKSYMPRMFTAMTAQITEHQSDSTNEEVPYHMFELLGALAYITRHLEVSLRNLKINV